MVQKISITLDENIVNFIDSQAKNRSQFINEVLSNFQKQQKLKELELAYIQQAEDADELAEIAAWDKTVGDELEADD